MSYRFSRLALVRLAVFISPCLIAAAPLTALAAEEFPVSAAQMQSLGVKVQRLEKSAELSGQTYSARVVLAPGQDQLASAPLAGVVDQLLVAENDAVKTGQPLLRLISPELGELQLKLMEVSSSSQLTQKALQRERQLFSEGIIPERRVQEAEAVAAQDLARKRQAEAALRLVGLDSAKIRNVAAGGNVESTVTVRAKASGVVADLSVKPGQRVQQADMLLRLANPGKLGLDIQIPSSRTAQVATVKGGQIAVVGRSGVQGEAVSLSPTVNDNQVLTMKATITKGAEQLRPGEIVQVQVPFADANEGWSVPLQSVVRQGDKAYVFLRTEKGFVATPVTVLASAGQTVRVSGKLQAGQEVATASVIALKAAWQGKGGSN